MKAIKIGTRGSKLALWQAYYVSDKLKEQGLETEIVIIETKGDKILDKALSKIGSKGVFTEELEEQLRSGGIDIAVHSAKDMQATLHEDFQLIAFTEREQVNDVLVSHKPISFKKGDRLVIGTSSVRRVSMLKHYYPEVEVVDVRGNLQTRMRKMEEGLCDALLLAYAGVHRMGYEDNIIYHFPLKEFTPATGQGSVAIEASASMDDETVKAIRQAVNHTTSEIQLKAERAFLKKLQGGCSIPAFCLATIDGEQLHVQGGLIATDGTRIVRHERKGSFSEAETMGYEVAVDVLEDGGKEILAEIRN